MKIKVAIAQFSMPDNYEKCIEKADEYIKTASKNGVDLLLLPELFEGLYFCQIENYDFSQSPSLRNLATAISIPL